MKLTIPLLISPGSLQQPPTCAPLARRDPSSPFSSLHWSRRGLPALESSLVHSTLSSLMSPCCLQDMFGLSIMGPRALWNLPLISGVLFPISAPCSHCLHFSLFFLTAVLLPSFCLEIFSFFTSRISPVSSGKLSSLPPSRVCLPFLCASTPLCMSPVVELLALDCHCSVPYPGELGCCLPRPSFCSQQRVPQCRDPLTVER